MVCFWNLPGGSQWQWDFLEILSKVFDGTIGWDLGGVQFGTGHLALGSTTILRTLCLNGSHASFTSFFCSAISFRVNVNSVAWRN
jgi:hypothetical protein